MAETGKGSGESFDIKINVDLSSLRTGLAGISKTVTNISTKIQQLTTTVYNLQASLASTLHSMEALSASLVLNVSFVSAEVDEATLQASVENIINRIRAQLELAGKNNQFKLPVTFSTAAGGQPQSMDALYAMVLSVADAMQTLKESLGRTSETMADLEKRIEGVTKQAKNLKNTTKGEGILGSGILSRGITYSTVYSTIFGQLGYLVWAVRNVYLTASNIGRTIKSMVIDIVGVQQNFFLTLTTITGSVEKAKELKSVIYDISRTVGVSTEALMSVAQQAAVYNIPFQRIEELLKTIPVFAQMVGTVSGGGASGASAITSRVIMAIGQMYAKGKVVAEERRQLANVGINIVELIAEGMGKPSAEVEDMMRKGLLTNVDEVVGLILKELEKKTKGIQQFIGKTTTGALKVTIQSLKQIWTYIAGTIAKTLTPALSSFASKMSEIAKITDTTGNLFYAVKTVLGEGIYNALTTIYAWGVNIYVVISQIFKTILNIFTSTTSALKPFLIFIVGVEIIGFILSSALRLMKPLVQYFTILWKVSGGIAQYLKTLPATISKISLKSLSWDAIMKSIHESVVSTMTLLTMGVALALFGATMYLMNAYERTATKRLREALSKIESQSANIFNNLKPDTLTKGTEALVKDTAEAAKNTEKVRDNLQSFDVIHALQEATDALETGPETMFDIKLQDYTPMLDNIDNMLESLNESVGSIQIPELGDLKVTMGDVWRETIKSDIGGFFGTLQKTADKISEAFSELLKKLGIILPETKTKEETTNDLVGALVDLKTGGFSWQGIKDLATAANEYIKKTPGGTTVAGGVGLITGYTGRLLTGDPMSRWVLSRTHETSIGNAPEVKIEFNSGALMPEMFIRSIEVNGKRVMPGGTTQPWSGWGK